jgi:hypothetical protein
MQQNEKQNASEVLKLTSKDFDRPGLESVITSKNITGFDDLRNYLTGKLAYLLEHNFEKLLNTLYIIDIDEEKLRKLFGGKNRDYIPSKLADLIIERQIQKIEFRSRFKEKKDQ